MTTEAIRSLPTSTLREIVNGMAGVANPEYNDRFVRFIAQSEIDQRRGR